MTESDRYRLVLQSILLLEIGAEEKMKLIKYLGDSKKYGDIATKISLISRRPIKKYAFPYQPTKKGMKEFYVNRHHTLVGNAVSDILIANKDPKNFKCLKVGSK